MLKCKQIYLPVICEDGIRVSVMSRHTLNDGITPDPAITENLFHEHWPELAPPLRLIGAYYKHRMPWGEFVQSYRNHLASKSVVSVVDRLIALATNRAVTVLCKEKDPMRCHRSVLLEFCILRNPDLEILVE